MQCQKIPQRNALIKRIAGSETRKSKGYIERERGSYAENRKINEIKVKNATLILCVEFVCSLDYSR